MPFLVANVIKVIHLTHHIFSITSLLLDMPKNTLLLWLANEIMTSKNLTNANLLITFGVTFSQLVLTEQNMTTLQLTFQIACTYHFGTLDT